jgi:hypothetical protein
MAQGQNAEMAAAIMNAALQAITKANRDPATPMDLPKQDTQQLAEQVTQQIQQTPEYKHLASTETSPWQSRAWWSRNVSLAAPFVAGLIGYTLPSDYNEVIAGVLWAVANVVAAYLAQRARTATRPLGG